MHPSRKERVSTREKHKINSIYNLEGGDYVLETEEYGKKRATEFTIRKGIFYWGDREEKKV